MGEACAAILREAGPLAPEQVALDDALGRVLAEDVRSAVTLPPWDNASMDGYAVRAEDIRGATAASPVRLRVTGTVAAGGRNELAVERGTAVRIMTGAPLPAAADTVVRVEDTDGGTSVVAIRSDRDARRNVRPRGEDVATDGIVARAGEELHPGHIGFLASVGRRHVAVVRRPRVAILSTGDELVDIDRFDEVQAGRKIVSSSSHALAAAVREAGGVPQRLGLVADDPAAIRDALQDCAADLVLSTGGVSVGAFDHTRAVIAGLGGTHLFWKVRIRPGAPVAFGLLRGHPWLGLPGNPVSTLVTFELFALPAIRRMSGHTQVHRRTVAVRLDEDVAISAPLTHFLRARVSWRGTGLTATLTGPQGSGLLSSMARANALLIVPPDRPRIAAGESARAILLHGDTAWSDEPPTP